MKLIDKKLYELTPKELRILNDKWNRYMCHNLGDGIGYWNKDCIIDSYNHYSMTEFLINQSKTNYEIDNSKNLMKTFFRHFDERGSYWSYVEDSFFYELDECRLRVYGSSNTIRNEYVVNEIKNMSPNELKKYMEENRYSEMDIKEKEITYTKIYNKDELTI